MTDIIKPRVLVFGGMPHNIPNDLRRACDIVRHITVDDAKRLNVSTMTNMGKYDCVIVIVRFANKKDARTLQATLSVPCIFAAGGWGKMQSELIRHGFLVNVHDNSTPKAKVAPVIPAPPAQPVESPPPSPSSTGLPPEELWRIYGAKAINCVRTVLKPGEKVLEADLIDALGLEVGLPPSDLIALLPELAVRGILESITETTWRLASVVGGEYEMAEDRSGIGEKKLAERKVPKPNRDTLELIKKIRGVDMGPYKSKSALHREMMKYAEFRNSDGTEMSEWTGYVRIQQAIQEGLVEEHFGKLFVDHDETVQLTLMIGPKAVANG